MHDSPELKTLVHDNQSGAREIAERALGLLQRAATQSSATTPGGLLDDLSALGVKIVRSKPEMAPVFRVLDDALRDAETHEGAAPELGPYRLETLSLLQRHVEAVRKRIEAAARHAQGLVANGDVILTTSRSSTVLEALRIAKREGKAFDVIATESRPNLEGRTLARELAAEQIPVRLLVDNLAATALAGADRVLVGADALTTTSLINKVGTHVLLLAALDAKVPVTVVAETTKAWPKRDDPALGLVTGRTRDPREVWDAPPPGVEVVNLYYERVPLELVTDVVDETGVHTPLGFWQRSRQRGNSKRFAAAFAGELP